MKKIKGSGRIKKKLSQFLGKRKERAFRQYVVSGREGRAAHQNVRSIPDLALVTFVNAANFHDLFLSVLSFTKVVGTPREWTLYADDTFSEMQKKVLSEFKFINTVSWDERLSADNRKKYSAKWQLRKFAAYAAHPLNGSTIYLDSDILFYPLFNKFMQGLDRFNWYLPEPPEASNVDPLIYQGFGYKREMYIINAGFFILNTAPDWQRGFDYIDRYLATGSENYFPDQTALNIMFYHDTKARVLDPRVFHASTADHFSVGALDTGKFAIRHYVGLIRHKMWQSGWKQFIK